MISAKEARQKSIYRELLITSGEYSKIEKLIDKATDNGKYSVSQDGVLSSGCINHLESLGYDVETGIQYNEPWYCIKW